jgi:agmatinase
VAVVGLPWDGSVSLRAGAAQAPVRLRELSRTGDAVTRRGRVVIALGGDNAVSIPSIEAFVRRHGKRTGIVWFDAHPDVFESCDGSPDSHACALRTVLRRTSAER